MSCDVMIHTIGTVSCDGQGRARLRTGGFRKMCPGTLNNKIISSRVDFTRFCFVSFGSVYFGQSTPARESILYLILPSISGDHEGAALEFVLRKRVKHALDEIIQVASLAPHRHLHSGETTQKIGAGRPLAGLSSSLPLPRTSTNSVSRKAESMR